MTRPQEKANERGRSIQTRLIQLLFFILLPVLALQAYIYYDSYQAHRESELQANLEIARAVSKNFASFVRDVLHQELAIGLAITSSQPLSVKDIARLLETSHDYDDAVRDFTWMNPNGDAVYSGNPAVIGRNYSDRSYLREIVNGREWAVSELLISKASGKPVFGISRGIRDEKGSLIGVVVAMIIPDKLDTQLAVERSKGGAFSLVDSKGMLVYRYPAINTKWEERNWLKLYPEYEDVLKGKEVIKTVYAPYEEKNRLVGLTPVSSIGWVAGAGKREEDVIGPILVSLAKSAFLFLSVSIAAFFIALAVSRKITNPVRKLRAHALALGQGANPEQITINRVSEFQDLAEAFTTMQEKVRARERALRESEERYRNIVETANEGIWTVDAELKTTFINKKMAEMLGHSSQEMMGMSALDFMDEEGKTITKKRLENRAPGFRGSYEHKYIRNDGMSVWTIVNAVSLQDSEGKFAGSISMLTDITERKQAEEALHQAHARAKWLASLPEENPNPVLRVSSDGNSRYCNPASMELEGWKCEEGLRVPSPILPLVRKSIAEDREVIQDVNLGERTYWVAVTSFPEEGYANVYGRDITERKQAEDMLRESEEALRRINNYLEQRVQERTIHLQNLAEQLEKSRGDLRKLVSELVMAEERERKRIAGVLHDEVAQTLAAARMRIDMLQSIPSDSNDKQTLEETKALLMQSIQETRALMTEVSNPLQFDMGLQAACVSLADRIMKSHPVRISCDVRDAYKHLNQDVKTILYQVLRELMNNVVKHSKAQNAHITIAMENGHFHLRVTDDGLGFDTKLLGAPTVEGGFGLYSIRERLIAVGGTLKIESAPGAGTVVMAILPAVLS